jgi:hypothetical protein
MADDVLLREELAGLLERRDLAVITYLHAR